MNLANRLEKKLSELHLSQSDLAKLTGISQQSISAIARGETKRSRHIVTIAKALKCDAEWLMSGERVIHDIDLTGKKVPVISYVQAGEFAEKDVLSGDFEYILTSESVSSTSFALRIHGDSMEPDFREGDIVIIDPRVKPSPGEFVAACNGSHEATFKKYKPHGITKEGDDDFELIPLNSDYPSYRSSKEIIKIIGTMVEHRIYRRKR